jgi:hypothetical protein
MPKEKVKKQPVVATPSPQKAGLPLKVNKPIVLTPDKTKALENFISGIRDMAGIAGDVGLRSFAEGLGVDFKIVNNEMVAEMREKGDTGLYLDGQLAYKNKDNGEVLRGYLKELYKKSNTKTK